MKDRLIKALKLMGIDVLDVSEGENTFAVLPPSLYKLIVDEVRARESLREGLIDVGLGRVQIKMRDKIGPFVLTVTDIYTATVIEIGEIK